MPARVREATKPSCLQICMPCSNEVGMGATRAVTGGDGDSMQQTVRERVGDGDKDIFCRAVMGSSTYACVILWQAHLAYPYCLCILSRSTVWYIANGFVRTKISVCRKYQLCWHLMVQCYELSSGGCWTAARVIRVWTIWSRAVTAVWLVLLMLRRCLMTTRKLGSYRANVLRPSVCCTADQRVLSSFDRVVLLIHMHFPSCE